MHRNVFLIGPRYLDLSLPYQQDLKVVLVHLCRNGARALDIELLLAIIQQRRVVCIVTGGFQSREGGSGGRMNDQHFNAGRFWCSKVMYFTSAVLWMINSYLYPISLTVDLVRFACNTVSSLRFEVGDFSSANL
jgi:hypothetical protein